jgi:hypothetical protein
MKLESPSDLFNPESFLTATGPTNEGMSEVDKQLFEEAQRTSLPMPGTEGFAPEMHTQPQQVSPAARNNLRETYSREVLAQERAEMAAETLKPSRYGSTIPLAKDVFADIIASGDYREEVHVARHTWELRALEQSDILCAADDVRDTADGQLGYLNAFTFAKLVYALEGIDGYSIYQLFPDILANTFRNKIDYIIAIKMALRAYLLAFPVPVIDELVEHHMRIETIRDEKIAKLKNS